MKASEPDPQDVEFLISRLIDGDLDEPARRTLEEQLAAKPDLDTVRREYEHIEGWLRRAAPPVDLDSAGFEQQVLRRCREWDIRQRQRHTWRWAGGLLAAAAAVTFVTTVAFRGGWAGRSATVAEISVGPHLTFAQGESRNGPASEFSFSRGGATPRDGVALESAAPEAGTVIIACASPILGNGGWLSGDMAF